MSDQSEEDDRTEEPTQRKLDEAIRKGDVAKSQELNTFFILGGFALVVLILSGPVARQLALDMRGFLMNAHQVPYDSGGVAMAGRNALLATLAAVALPFVVFLLAGMAGGAIQHRPLWTTEPMMPQVSRISPLSGFKRLFGKEAWVQFSKGLAKIGIIGAVVTVILWSEHDRLDGLIRMEPIGLLPAIKLLSVKLLGGVLAIFAFVAIGDALYQRMSWMKRQRMTIREIKDEHKEQEGNPEIKAKLRQIRMMRVRKRMMAAVPSATVIVTNPTHYAVALKFESGMQAPVCVAKGVDAVALRIRAVATQHDVPIVENPPLARALHATVEIDAEIPVEHYKAVAEVVGYVLRLRRRPA